MKTFCDRCNKEVESKLIAEIRECECSTRWECHDNPETTALREKIERQKAALALSVKQYNEGVDAAKAGFAAGPRPDFDTSSWYDGYASAMHPILVEKNAELNKRVAELEAALSKWKECAKMLADELTEANSERFPVSWEDASESSPAWIVYANLKGGRCE